jgi:hypothetical protein
MSYEVVSPGDLELFDETTIGGNWTVDSSLNHYSMDETTVGFEQQLRRDLKVAVTGIWRSWDNFVGAVIKGSRWTPFTRSLPDPSNPTSTKPYTLYRWANRVDEPDTVVTNYKGFQFQDPSGNVLGVSDPSREYKGVMFVLTKTLSNRWQGQFSYVWSQAKGSITSSGVGLGSNGFRNPNIALVNSYGFMELDRTHEFKLMGGYTIPKVEVALNAYFRSLSGANYTPVANVSGSSSVLNWTGSLNINLEPRGSQSLDTLQIVDLRVEKEFRVDVHRLGVFFDFANLFNSDVVTGVQTRVPTRTITDPATGEGFPVKYKSPTSLTPPRQMTFGVRWSF